MEATNLRISVHTAVQKSGGYVTGTMNGKQEFITGQTEAAAHTVLGGQQQNKSEFAD